jgi:hypothetical protein
MTDTAPPDASAISAGSNGARWRGSMPGPTTSTARCSRPGDGEEHHVAIAHAQHADDREDVEHERETPDAHRVAAVSHAGACSSVE